MPDAKPLGADDMTEDKLHQSLAGVFSCLKEAGLKTEYWHSGGGIYGVMVWIEDGKTLFWAPVDGKWGYELGEADGDFITGGDTEISATNFDEEVLTKEILSSVRAFSAT